MSKKSKIWMSQWPRDSFYWEHLYYERDLPNERELEIIQQFKAGELVDVGDFPNPIWTDLKDTKNKEPKDAFRIKNGFLVVSGRFRSLLEEFDLGRTQFVPVNVYKKNRRDPYEREYFYINIVEFKKTVVPEQSYRKKIFKDSPAELVLEEVRNRPGQYRIALNDPDMGVLSAAQDGPDLWFDPAMRFQAVFCSDRLRQAVKTEKIKTMRFSPCRFVD